MKKRILFVTNHLQFGDGVANALVGFVNALDKEKYEITIMPFYKCDMEFIKQIDSKVKIKNMFNCYFRGMDKLVNLISYRVWYRVFVKDRYDVEVAFQYGAPTKLIASSQNKNAKHIAWMHGYGEELLNTHEHYDKIVCCSKCNMERYKKVYKYPERISYLYNLIKDDEILAKSKESVETKNNFDFTFCTVGRLSPEKGFDRLLECHKKLLDEGYNHNLWIVGGGPEELKLKNYIEVNDLNESVAMYGQQNNPFKYMIKSDMFVCSSYSEGFSTVCVEAAILGKSVITTDVPGGKEFVADNNIGIMVNNDTEALYEGMKYILENKSKIAEYEANIANVKDMHYEDRLQAVLEFFENC